jgi:hypothetical protein
MTHARLHATLTVALAASLVAVCWPAAARADGAWVEEVHDERGRVTHVVPRQHAAIAMRAETVTLVPFYDPRIAPDHPLVLVNVRYTFANPQDAATLLVGFPELLSRVKRQRYNYEGKINADRCDVQVKSEMGSTSVTCPSTIVRFDADVGDRALPVKVMPGIGHYRRWFAFPVAFAARGPTQVRNLYVAHAGRTQTQSNVSGALSYTLEYVLHTGASWRGPIGSADIAVWDGGWRLRRTLKDLRPTTKDDLRLELDVVQQRSKGRPLISWDYCNGSQSETPELAFEKTAVVHASSSRRAERVHVGAMVLDRDPTTAWIDGNASGAIGEWVQIPTHALSQQIRALVVQPGPVGPGVSRPRRLVVACHDRQGNSRTLRSTAQLEIALADEPRPQRVIFPTPLGVCHAVRVTVAELHGPRTHHVAIAELEPLGAGPMSASGARPYRGELVEGLARVEQGGKWGFVDARGQQVIPTGFEWAESFSEGLAAVRRDGRWGFIDRAGKMVVAPSYADAARFSEGLAAVKRAATWSYIDRQGKVRLAGPFEEARPFRCGVARVKREKICLVDSSCREHGHYQSSCASAEEREEKVRPFHAVSEAPAAAGGAEPRRGGWRVDAVVAPVLFSDQKDMTPESAIQGEQRGRYFEAQWEEHAWQVIDRSGKPAPGARWSCAKR